MKRFICMLLAMALLGGAACAEMKTVEEHVSRSIPKITIRKNPVIEGESPLTGLPADGEAYTPIMLPLDNSPEAYPQWGIGDASMLFQVPLKENGATRLLALFGDKYPDQAGGARSGRMTMLPIARAFNAAFVYAGYPPIGTQAVSVEYWLGEWSFRKPTRHYNLLGVNYRERVSDAKDPYNLSAHISEIHRHIAGRKVDFDVSPYLFTDKPLDRGDNAAVINVEYTQKDDPSKTNEGSACTFTWKPEAGYIRTSAAGEMTDKATGETVSFANVIIMRVPVLWERGYAYYEDQMRGYGQADIFQSGRYIRGAWYHPDHTERLVFLDENGQELTLQRGRTFIATGSGLVVSYSEQ